jgi:NADH-ubiquinone oxidoreductase chain 5
MLILIILLPLFGFVSGSLFGRFLNRSVPIITTFFTFLSFIFSICLLFDIIYTGNVYIIKFMRWIYVDSLRIDWGFCFDSLTAVMLVIITSISTLVHLYSTEYMSEDPHLTRFMSYLSLFTFFMLILVTADNFIQMFVGWEGVGVSSYLLINFWFTRIQANKAAIKAMLMNRVGDLSMLLALLTIFYLFNSFDYNIIFTLIPLYITSFITLGIFEIPAIDFVCILLFIGAMGKSAQIGLHHWLPDAMEGPTPVSALIHAATMVTAGVFLLTRCSYIFEFSLFSLNMVILIGSITAFFASTTGLFQNDMKKIIAYSTCSQLGYMIFACGLSSYDVGMFHLSNHAYFKALLFLGAGSVIHALADEQDLRKMGGLSKILPFSYSIMLIGSFALMGFPFLAGFYSKDIILEISFATYTISSHFSYILGTLAAFATAFYSIRLLYLVFLSSTNGNKNIVFNAHESSLRMTFPLFLLTLASIFIGYLSKELFIGFGCDFWGSSIFINSFNYIKPDIEFIEHIFKILPFWITLFGSACAFVLYNYLISYYFFLKQNNNFKYFYTFFNKKWFLDRLYNKIFTQLFLKFSYEFNYKIIDRGYLEIVGPLGFTQKLIILKDSIFLKHKGIIIEFLFYIVFFTFFCTLQHVSLCDASLLYQIGTQDPVTPAMEGMRYFPNDLMFCIICIKVIVYRILLAKLSFSYSLNESDNSKMTLEVIDKEWYWRSEQAYRLAKRIAYPSSYPYVIPLEELKILNVRLLTFHNVVILPIKTMLHILVTSLDILHSWAVPSIKIKTKARPVKLSKVSLYIKRAGYFYGPCNDGAFNYEFMPIVVEGIKKQEFFSLFPSKKSDI